MNEEILNNAVYNALQDVTVDALVTVQHAHELARQLTVSLPQALADQGYYLAPIIPAETGGARTTDPQTSRDSTPSIMRAGSQRHLLLETFGRWPDDGLTDEEAMYRTHGVSASSEYATRCSELRRAGLLKDSGRTRESDSGQARMVSEITDMGEAELRRLLV